MNLRVGTILALISIVFAAPVFAQQPTVFYNGRAAVASEVLVRLRSNDGNAVTRVRQAVTGAQFEELNNGLALHLVRSGNNNLTGLLQALANHPDVLYAEPNYIVQAVATQPNDPSFSILWGMTQIAAPDAWDIAKGGTSAVIGIVDSGIDYNHPDLSPNVWSAPAAFTVTVQGHVVNCLAGSHGFNAINFSCDPNDDNNHGSHVSGTIGAAGNNNVGVTGVNWTAKMMGLKFLGPNGSGPISAAIAAIEFAIQVKAKFAGTATPVDIRVLSNSWGSSGPSQSLLDEINKANTNEMLFVAAAGNNGTNNDTTSFYPAVYSTVAPNVIAVAATDVGDTLASFSNYGRQTVQLGAPGVGIYSTVPGNGYDSYSGTSMSTPHVAGAALLTASACPYLNTQALKAAILNNVDPVSSLSLKTVTGGRLNVNKAVRSCSLTLQFDGLTVDRVGRGEGAQSPDGQLDGVFTVTTPPGSGNRTVTQVTLTSGAAQWDTIAGNGYWVAGISGSLNGVLFNSANDTVNYPVAAGNSFKLFVSDNQGTYFGAAGVFTVTLRFSDGTLAAATVTTTGTEGARTNVALASNGGVAVASSTYSNNYPAAGTINGDRKGLLWNNGGGWHDATAGFPDWLEIDFNGPQTIAEVDVFTVQDNAQTPAAPTPTMTFSLYGLRDFEVQYWTGTLWATIPGATVSGNNLVWRQFLFAPLTTTKIRVYITAAADGESRITEVEAYSGVTLSPDFQISASPSSLTLSQGGSGTSTATVTALAGFSSSVTLGVTGCPSGATCSIAPSVTPNPTATPTLSVSTTAATSTGTFTLTITGTSGALVRSTTVTLTVNTAGTLTNVALASNGGVAVASSTYSNNYPAAGTINGDRKGLLWNNGGGWHDATAGFPDWLEIDFNGPQTIAEVDVFTVQDNAQTPTAPTPTMTFSLYGLRDFEVQYWTGTVWATIPGATVSGNNLVWRQFLFAPLTTTKIRVYITAAADGESRITEVEAYSGVTLSPDFQISASPSSLTLSQGGSGTSTATVTALAGFSSSVTLGVTGCPSGATCSIAPSVTPNPTATPTLSVSTTAATSTGTFTLTITGTSGALVRSTTVTLTVNTAGTLTNVALATNGGVAVASSTYSNNYPAAGTINGDRKGLLWNNGGGWHDATAGFPDWLEIDFNGPQTIAEVDVFTVQDNAQTPAAPTPTMTFSLYGLRDFEVQYWTGTLWATIPGATVSGNNLVWRQFLFAPLTTTKIRVYITAAADGESRITEVEAYSGVTLSPDFQISASPSSLTLSQGGSGTSTATVTALAGFSSSVTLGVTGCPSGATCSIAPSVTPNPTATPTLSVSTTAATSTGTFTLTITGTSGALVRSTTVTLTVNTAGTLTNVALASNGGVAVASSTYSNNYPAAGTINGDRKGLLWNNGGGWHDATAGFPDWLEIDFNGPQTIGEVDVFTVQDNAQTPAAPTPTMTFNLYGLRDFEVQYWTGTLWATIPGATVSGNNLVWRQFLFAPLTTTKIRVYITAAADGESRITEVEAYSGGS